MTDLTQAAPVVMTISAFQRLKARSVQFAFIIIEESASHIGKNIAGHQSLVAFEGW